MGLSHTHDLDRGFERFNQVYSGLFFLFFSKIKKILIFFFNILLIRNWVSWFILIFFLWDSFNLMTRVANLADYPRLTLVNLICCYLSILRKMSSNIPLSQYFFKKILSNVHWILKKKKNHVIKHINNTWAFCFCAK